MKISCFGKLLIMCDITGNYDRHLAREQKPKYFLWSNTFERLRVTISHSVACRPRKQPFIGFMWHKRCLVDHSRQQQTCQPETSRTFHSTAVPWFAVSSTCCDKDARRCPEISWKVLGENLTIQIRGQSHGAEEANFCTGRFAKLVNYMREVNVVAITW